MVGIGIVVLISVAMLVWQARYYEKMIGSQAAKTLTNKIFTIEVINTHRFLEMLERRELAVVVDNEDELFQFNEVVSRASRLLVFSTDPLVGFNQQYLVAEGDAVKFTTKENLKGMEVISWKILKHFINKSKEKRQA